MLAAAFVVVGQREDLRAGALPLLIELVGHGAHAGLIAAAVADEQDLVEAVALQAARRRVEQHVVGGRGQRDHAGSRAIGIAFRHVLDRRRDERVLQSARHQVRGVRDDVIVLAENHVVAVLLGAAGRHDHTASCLPSARRAFPPTSTRR